MYHQVNEKIDLHLTRLYQNYPIVIPGQQLAKNKLSICLTFDDAYEDFYTYAYPVLQRLQIPAVLAIPVAFVGKPNYCSWPQLEEMINSKLVIPASHSKNHVDMTLESTDLHEESFSSKQILEKNLNTTIDTFVYPYGCHNSKVNQSLKNTYEHTMRIGSAINYSWQQPYIYRVDADYLWKKDLSINKKLIIKSKWKYLINKLRGA